MEKNVRRKLKPTELRGREIYQYKNMTIYSKFFMKNYGYLITQYDADDYYSYSLRGLESVVGFVLLLLISKRVLFSLVCALGAYIDSDMTIRQGLEKLRAHGYSAIPVINKDSTYYGVVSEGDFLWNIMNDNVITVEELEKAKVKNIIRKKVPSCKIDVSYQILLNMVTNYNFVPIIDDRNILMGIITRKSILDNLKK